MNSYRSITRDGKKYLEVCRSSELVEHKGKKIEFPEDHDMQVALFRIKGKLYCISNICPHEHTEKMYQAVIDDGKLVCPYHAWTFYLESGQNINPNQGIKGLKTYEIFEEHGKVYIEKPKADVPLWRKIDYKIDY